MDYPIRSALTSTLPIRLAQSSQRNRYLSPEEFEARLVQPGIQSAWLPAGLRFRRHEEIPPVPQDGSCSA